MFLHCIQTDEPAITNLQLQNCICVLGFWESLDIAPFTYALFFQLGIICSQWDAPLVSSHKPTFEGITVITQPYIHLQDALYCKTTSQWWQVILYSVAVLHCCSGLAFTSLEHPKVWHFLLIEHLCVTAVAEMYISQAWMLVVCSNSSLYEYERCEEDAVLTEKHLASALSDEQTAAVSAWCSPCAKHTNTKRAQGRVGWRAWRAIQASLHAPALTSRPSTFITLCGYDSSSCS